MGGCFFRAKRSEIKKKPAFDMHVIGIPSGEIVNT